MDIHPSGWTRPITVLESAAPEPVRKPSDLDANTSSATRLDPTSGLAPGAGPIANSLLPIEPDLDGDEAEALDGVSDIPSALASPAASGDISEEDTLKSQLGTLVDASELGVVLAPYHEFNGATAPVLESSRSAVVDAVVAVVAAEGPVIGRRLHQSYVRAAGGQRVGKQIGRALNSVISTAVRRGLLVEEDPLGEQGVKPRTYRLPDQPSVRPRQLGPRTLDQVPPAELARIMGVAARSVGWHDREQLFRTTLGLLGLRRLTAQAHDRLQKVLVVAERDE